MRLPSQGFLLIIVTGVMWGTIGVAAKYAYAHSELDPIGVNWIRSLIAVPICLAIAWRTMGRRMLDASRRDLAIMAGVGCVLIIYQYLYLAAIEQVGIAIATLITLCTPPILVALISVPVYREPLTGRLLVALVGATAGTALLIAGGGEHIEGAMPIGGVLLAFGSALGVTTHVMASRFIAGRHPPMRPLVIGFPAGALLFAPVALTHGVTISGIDAAGWFWLIYLGIGPSVLGYLLYQRGLRDVTATAASIVTLLEPMVATLLGWLLFDEVLTLIAVAGGMLLVGSIMILSLTARPGQPKRDGDALKGGAAP